MKNYIETFESFESSRDQQLNEKKYEYGCSMIFFDMPEMYKIQDSIDPNDLHENGFEDEPHITLLYGLHSEEIEDSKVMDASSLPIQKIKLTKISAFENDDFDVLKFDVDCPEIHEINKELTKLPHTTNFPDYHPHSTIAYLKPGMAKKYIDKLKNVSAIEVNPSKIVYSKPDGERITKSI
jgi:2'-5' RNA ligase